MFSSSLIRIARPVLAAAALMLALAACGQKGDLYLPRAPAAPAASTP